MKKILTVFLMIVLVSSMFVGCQPTATPAATTEAGAATEAAPATTKGVKIGVSIASFDDTFLVYMMDGMKAHQKTLTGVEITYVDAKEDTAKQLEQVENFITQGVNSIVVVPVNTEATAPITEACMAAGVNLVYVNRLPANLPDGVVFVGSQSIDAGIFQMEYIGEKLGGKGNVVIMMGKLDNEASLKRTEGNKQVIAEKYPDIKVIKEQTANWSRAEGMSLMENWLSSGDEIAAVLCNNDDMALGAIQALEAAGLKDKILVGGVDATPDAIAEVSKGKLDVTVFQDAGGQGSGGIQAAFDKAMGISVDKEVWIPFQLVTPDNVADFQ
jgi:inositol transport system substrate-binding protein